MLYGVRSFVRERFDRAVLSVVGRNMRTRALRRAVASQVAAELERVKGAEFELGIRRIVEERLNARAQGNYFIGILISVALIPLTYFSVSSIQKDAKSEAKTVARNEAKARIEAEIPVMKDTWNKAFQSVMQTATQSAVQAASSSKEAKKAEDSAKKAQEDADAARGLAETATKEAQDASKSVLELVKIQDADQLVEKLLATPQVQNALQRATEVLPVGAILAFPGTRQALEKSFGRRWRVCDGTTVDVKVGSLLVDALRPYNPNYSGTGPMTLPDFQGYFLRGEGGPSGKLGEPQRATTARPHVDRGQQRGGFGSVLTSQAEGTTVYPRGEIRAGTRWEQPGHLIGWDDETRPVNIAVNWIIRVE